MNRRIALCVLTFFTLLGLCCSGISAQRPSPAKLQRYFQQGHEALAHGHFAEAEAAFRKLTQLDPTAAVPYANLGLVYFEERKFTEAIPVFQRALKLDSSLSNARYFLAMSLSEVGRYDQALPGLEEGFRSEADPKLKRLLGLHLEKAYTGVQRDRDAVEVALHLTALYPNDAEVLYQTGRLCANFSYLSIQKLGRVAPGSVWRHLASGDYYETQGDYALAEREYRSVLSLAPRMPGIHYRLGRALLDSKQLGSQAEALKEFEQELALDPTNGSAAYEAGEIYRKMGDLSKAQGLLDDALKHYPDLEEAQVEMGRVLMAEKQPQLAVAHLQKALSLNPEDDIAYFQLAQAYHALGNAAEERKALAEFQRLKAEKAQHQEKLSVGAYTGQGATE